MNELCNGYVYRYKYREFVLVWLGTKRGEPVFGRLFINGHEDRIHTTPIFHSDKYGRWEFTLDQLRRFYNADDWELVDMKLDIVLTE